MNPTTQPDSNLPIAHLPSLDPLHPGLEVRLVYPPSSHQIPSQQPFDAIRNDVLTVQPDSALLPNEVVPNSSYHWVQQQVIESPPTTPEKGTELSDRLTGLQQNQPLVGQEDTPANAGDATANTGDSVVTMLQVSAPPFPGRLLRYTPGQPSIRGADVRQWQAQMRTRGWSISVDGIYGRQSAEICRQFQREKGLQADGIVGRRTWEAAFTSPPGSSSKPDEHGNYKPKVSSAFLNRLKLIEKRLGVERGYLLAVMGFETGGTYRPSKRNPVSGATGLIQFMPRTAKALGTSTKELAKMSAVRQLDYVEKYLQPYRGRLKTLQDTYMAVLNPVAIGKSSDSSMWRKGTIQYKQNSGLDINKNGVVTPGEATAKVRRYLPQKQFF